MDIIDKYEICPKCGCDWSAHFQMIEDDGTPAGKLLYPPKPAPCIECGCTKTMEE